jgi:DNA-binding response OmpR family regulator
MKEKSILIVEDDKWLAEQYVRIFTTANYKALIALNALDAIQMVDDATPDAIILDVLLTGSTAFALLHELQSYEDTGSIPIILCTNLASELSMDDLKPYGVKRILDKTKMMPGDLLTAVKSLGL